MPHRIAWLFILLAACVLTPPAARAQMPVTVSPNTDRALLGGPDTVALSAFRALLNDKQRWATPDPDVTPLGAYFADDAILLGRFGEIARGKQEILAWWKQKVSFGEVSFQRIALGASGRIIYVMGRYRHLIRRPDGRGRYMVDLGSYTSIWERQKDGAWRIQSMLVVSEPNPGSPANPGS